MQFQQQIISKTLPVKLIQSLQFGKQRHIFITKFRVEDLAIHMMLNGADNQKPVNGCTSEGCWQKNIICRLRIEKNGNAITYVTLIRGIISNRVAIHL